MHSISPHYLLVLSTGILPCTAAWGDFGGFNGYFPSPLFSSSTPLQALEKRALNPQLESGVNYNPNGTMFLWLPEDEYAGKTFFDEFDFFSERDPTNGHVNFVTSEAAFQSGLTYITDNGTVIMKADDFTDLAQGAFRNSVRITSKKAYNTGLFILDLNRAPWGCAVWPAFWTVGPNWPYGGEIDILEGVHDNEHNQIAWHTDNGCWLDSTTPFTGTIAKLNGVNNTNCWNGTNFNSGCDVTEWSRASYGPYFEEQGGGVIAMKWDENDISVWSFFRAAIPKDIIAGRPNPSQWGLPSASLRNTTCKIDQYFYNHSIVFDITFCGDWAGNSYATSGCPGSCDERLMLGANFMNAVWSINSLKIFKKQPISDLTSSASRSTTIFWQTLPLFFSLLCAVVLAL